MNKIACTWSAEEAKKITAAIASLLRGYRSETSDEAIEDYVSVLRGIRASWCLEAIERLRTLGREFRPSPGEVRQAALDPVPGPTKAKKCAGCGRYVHACSCEAVEPPAEAREILAKLGIDL